MSHEVCQNTISDESLSRRTFLCRTGATAAAFAIPTIVPASALGADGQVLPSNRITLAQFGLGIMGRGHTRRLIYDKAVQLVAVCDPDRTRVESTQARVAKVYGKTQGACDGYVDHREIMSRDDIDGVVIVTPDHWHTPLSLEAAKAGKDIYCEKPISVTVKEGRELVQAVRRYGRIFQTGTQYRSMPTIRKVCNFVRDGGLGQVKSVFTIWQRLAGPMGAARFKPYADRMDWEATLRSFVPVSLDLPGEPVPEGLDWQRWVGPAAWHPYNHVYHVNPAPGVVPWAFCREFGVGASTWYHSHAADVIQYALGMEESGPVELIHPKDGPYPTLTCKYANGTLLHLVENWNDVKRLYKAVPDSARLAGNFGGVFVGEKGWLTSMTTGGPIEGGPDAVFSELKLKSRDVDMSNNHHDNWFECVRTRQRPSTDAELGHRSASLGHLTIIAYELERSLKWDPVKEEFPGDAVANRLLARTKRIQTGV